MVKTFEDAEFKLKKGEISEPVKTESGASLAPEVDTLWDRRDHRSTHVFGLQVDAGVVRERIERRTREMFERGVEDEVRAAVAGRLSSTARRIHGLQDVTSCLAARSTARRRSRRLIVRTRRTPSGSGSGCGGCRDWCR